MMKISKHSTARTFNQYQRYLVKLGYKQIGDGADAEVYASPDETHALKVGTLRKNAVYLDYIKDTSHINSPWLPKVYDIKIFKCIVPYVAVVMEMLKNDCYSYTMSSDVERVCSDSFNRNKTKKYHYIARLKKIESKQKGLKRILPILVKIVNRSEPCEIDIHPGNIMRRPNGEYVLTDPLHQEL